MSRKKRKRGSNPTIEWLAEELRKEDERALVESYQRLGLRAPAMRERPRQEAAPNGYIQYVPGTLTQAGAQMGVGGYAGNAVQFYNYQPPQGVGYQGVVVAPAEAPAPAQPYPGGIYEYREIRDLPVYEPEGAEGPPEPDQR